MLIDSNGVIWAGCGDGKLIRFDPAALNINTKPLALQIQSVKVNSENICWYNLDPAGRRQLVVNSHTIVWLCFGKCKAHWENK